MKIKKDDFVICVMPSGVQIPGQVVKVFDNSEVRIISEFDTFFTLPLYRVKKADLPKSLRASIVKSKSCYSTKKPKLPKPNVPTGAIKTKPVKLSPIITDSYIQESLF